MTILSYQLGALRIDRLIESEQADPYYDGLKFFPGTSAEDWEKHANWLQPTAMHPVSGYLVFTIQSFLVRTGRYNILVDTCVGDYKHRRNTMFNMRNEGTLIKRLRTAGVHPAEIDYVMCTHMHADHVGWNTRLVDGRWAPTFTNAKYIFSRKEYDYWKNSGDPSPEYTDSVLPVVEAGQAVLVDNDYAMNAQIRLESTPGHTPDHFSIHLASDGREAVITGDLIHSPVQCQEPDWIMRADFAPAQARQTRRSFLDSYCETDVLICASHFPSPSFGHIVFRNAAYFFEYLRE